MTELREIYKCNVCGNIVEVLHAGKGELVCCGQPMQLQKENTVDASQEKHVPVIEETNDGYLIKVGIVEHPMNPEHYIEWIELVAGEETYRQYLQPEDKPEASFWIPKDREIYVRAYCNLHGLWMS